MNVNAKNMKWTRAPKQYNVTEDKVVVITALLTNSDF